MTTDVGVRVNLLHQSTFLLSFFSFLPFILFLFIVPAFHSLFILLPVPLFQFTSKSQIKTVKITLVTSNRANVLKCSFFKTPSPHGLLIFRWTPAPPPRLPPYPPSKNPGTSRRILEGLEHPGQPAAPSIHLPLFLFLFTLSSLLYCPVHQPPLVGSLQPPHPPLSPTASPISINHNQSKRDNDPRIPKHPQETAWQTINTVTFK